VTEPTPVSTSEVLGLLRQLGQEPAPEFDARDRAERDTRFAARIDAHLERLAFERRRAWRTRAWLLVAAAAVPLAVWSVRALDREPPALTIAREPTRARIAAVSSAQPAPAASEKPALAESVPQKSVAPPSSSAQSAAASGDSTLALENRIFSDAVADAHAGNSDAALRGFERLLREYPRSPLAQSALVRRLRILTAAGRIPEARAEARRYLTVYPTGFAKQEAEAALNERAESGAGETRAVEP
jgi:tetratricopeptide (TPR) repeat protein